MNPAKFLISSTSWPAWAVGAWTKKLTNTLDHL
jgi:hypothetical protein